VPSAISCSALEEDRADRYGLHVLTEMKNRRVGDVCLVVCDDLVGLPTR
jgi:transposase-like protein